MFLSDKPVQPGRNYRRTEYTATGYIRRSRLCCSSSIDGSAIAYRREDKQDCDKHPCFYTSAAGLSHIWQDKHKAGWFGPDKLKLAKTAVKQPEQPKATLMKAPPAVQTTLKQAAAKGNQTVKKVSTASQHNPPLKLFFSRTKLLSQEQHAEATWSYAVSEEDLLLLQKIVMAEAEGEPYQGKVAVANVVLNRLRSANYPDTIYKVIYQKSQFSPVANGRLKRVKPNEDSIKAVNAALSGVKEVTDDTYFFLSLQLAQDLTVHHSRTYAKTIGNHTFINKVSFIAD